MSQLKLGFSMQNEITEYYNQVADSYDRQRFGNSYGQTLHWEEKRILSKYLTPLKNARILDAGCGTGRFTNFATDAIDPAINMLEIARVKCPQCTFYQAEANHIPLADESLDALFAVHLFMHLDIGSIQSIFNETYRKLKPGGLFIFDIPSELRRSISQTEFKTWHCATSLSQKKVTALCGNGWKVKAVYGLSFFPLHRLPAPFRLVAFFIDILLSASPLKFLASFNFYILTKAPK